MDNEINSQDSQKEDASEQKRLQRDQHRSGSSHQHKPYGHRRSGKSAVENIVTTEFLVIIAVLFFVVGMAWIALRSETIPLVSRLIQNFFSVVEDKEHSITTLNPGSSMVNRPSVLLFLLPGILLIAFAIYGLLGRKSHSYAGKLSFYTGTFALYGVQVFFILYALFTRTSLPYSSLVFSVISTLLLTLPVSWLAAKEHKAWVHLVSVFYMLVMVMAMAIAYGITQALLFVMLFVFGASLFLLSGKTRGNLVTNALAWAMMLFYSILFLRKIFLSNDPAYVWFYLGFTLVLFVLVWINQIFNAYHGQTVWKKWFAGFSVYGISFFTAFTIGYALRKAGMGHSVWVFAAGLTLLQFALLAVSERFRPSQHQAVFYYSTLFVAASIVPLAVLRGMPLLYAGILSILLVSYAKRKKQPLAALLSVAILSGGVILMLALMVLRYYPALYLKNNVLSFDLFLFPFLSGLVLVLAARLTYGLFQHISFSYSHKWFSRSGTAHYLFTLYYLSLYISLFWLMQYLYFSVWNLREAQGVVGYFFHLIFLYFVIRYSLKKDHWLYEPFMWLSVISLLAWPLLINLLMIRLREQSMLASGDNVNGFLLTLLAIVPAIMLSWLATEKLKDLYPKLKEGTGLMYAFRFGILFYLLVASFDHLTVLSGSVSHAHAAITANRHIPYTLAFTLFAFLLMLFSFWKHLRLLRRISLVLIFMVLVKVFVFDFGVLRPVEKALSFWLSGGLLILYSLVYKQLNDRGKHRNSGKRSHTLSNKGHQNPED